VAVLANANGGFTNIIMCSSNLPDKVAIALDIQMDDGQLNGGAVRGQLNASANPTIATTVATTDVYAETGTNLYTLCRQF
jgi:hypothetical protein